MNWNVPNILTLIRLAAAPGVAIMFLYFARPFADWYALILFVLAAITDFFDGYLARLWKQESKFGAMLDPIADKAMVVIALLVIVGLSSLGGVVMGTVGRIASVGGASMDPWILLPATVILFREVFVSGLREYLGSSAGLLKVTVLAKYKTTVQMIAIAVLFGKGVFEHYFLNLVQGMDQEIFDGVMDGSIPDINHVEWYMNAMNLCWFAGVILLWVAAILTFVSGADYLRKAAPFLRDEK